MMSMQRGHVQAYRPSRGFGFIKPDGNFGDLFVRAEDVEDDHVDLVPGEPVEYQPQVGTGGQLMAVAVRRLRAYATDATTTALKGPADSSSHADL